MNHLPEIASFWTGSPLGWIEQLCLRSFVLRGHKVTLFQLDSVSNVPEGVLVRNMRDVWDPDPRIVSETGASFVADIFRLHLMKNTDMIWVDTDAYCLEPFHTNDAGYLVGHFHGRTEIANGVMRLPRDSAALEFLFRCLEDPAFIPPWLRPALRQRLEKIAPKDRLIQMYHMRRSVMGPKALFHSLTESGEIEHALHERVLYPIPWQFCDALFNPHGGVNGWINNDTISMHFYSSQVRRIHRNNPPDPDSYAGKLVAQDLGDVG